LGLRQRIKGFFAGEGEPRGPFYGQGELGNWFELGSIEDGFQRNLNLPHIDAKKIPAAYASVMANARAVSQCKPLHKRKDASGRTEVVMTSAASRLFQRPNSYETWPQFILNCVAQMFFDGESFAIASRNARGEVIRLDRMDSRTCSPYVTDGELFSSVGQNPFVAEEIDYLVPARDVLHLRQYCPRHVLMGESPIKAAAMAAGINVSLSGSQAAFFSQMSRPSGVLSTETVLNKDQLESLREAWYKQSQKIAQGHVPILSGGLKWQPMSISSQDAQLIDAQRLSIEEIARVYGVPLPVIGDMTSSTLNNVEQLISLWLSISLGSLLENIEQSFVRLFDMPANESVDFDVTGLLRTDFQARIDGLTKAIQGGLYTPNEARAREGLHPVENGEDPIVQAQMVPLGYETDSTLPPAENTRAVNINDFRKALRFER
jgi:HK97 family phage portal protein